jgi:hypothetical protein
MYILIYPINPSSDFVEIRYGGIDKKLLGNYDF